MSLDSAFFFSGRFIVIDHDVAVALDRAVLGGGPSSSLAGDGR